MHFSCSSSRMIKCPRSHPTADIVVRAPWAYIAEASGLRVLNIKNPNSFYQET
jgi:hypothetical protein